MKVDCQGCGEKVEVRLTTHKKRTPFVRCPCGYTAFYNGPSGEDLKRRIQKESPKKEKEEWF